MSCSSVQSKSQALELLTLAQRNMVDARAFKMLPQINFAIIAFHAQQCIEKCMKAVLAKHAITFQLTHDLDDLYALLQESKLEMPVSHELLNDITPYAMTTRY